MALSVSDEVLIAAPRDRVYEGLNDPEVLKACIPMCEELIRHSETELEAKVVLKLGPVKARISGKITLVPDGAPAYYTLLGEGSGRVAGFAKGRADVTLDDRGAETLLRYEASAEVGGKLASLGSRLVKGTSKQISDRFFERFQAELNARTGGE